VIAVIVIMLLAVMVVLHLTASFGVWGVISLRAV
jgi:hypothetical protein